MRVSNFPTQLQLLPKQCRCYSLANIMFNDNLMITLITGFNVRGKVRARKHRPTQAQTSRAKLPPECDDVWEGESFCFFFLCRYSLFYDCRSVLLSDCKCNVITVLRHCAHRADLSRPLYLIYEDNAILVVWQALYLTIWYGFFITMVHQCDTD